jgi:hypothetical protein
MIHGSIVGPVIATGAKERPFRRHASAAAVAIGPGIPFTIMRNEDASILPSLLSDVIEQQLLDDTAFESL